METSPVLHHASYIMSIFSVLVFCLEHFNGKMLNNVITNKFSTSIQIFEENKKSFFNFPIPFYCFGINFRPVIIFDVWKIEEKEKYQKNVARKKCRRKHFPLPRVPKGNFLSFLDFSSFFFFAKRYKV